MRPKLPSPGSSNLSLHLSLKTPLPWFSPRCPPKHHIHPNAAPVFKPPCLHAGRPLSLKCPESSLPPLQGGKLPHAFSPTSKPVQTTPPMGSFPRSPTTESPCLPLCSLAFIFVIACYKISHRTAEDIFLNCESDCGSPLHRTSQSLPKPSEGLTLPFTTQVLPTSPAPLHSRSEPHTSCA